MRILRKRRKRPDRTILWPKPYREDNKNLFFRIHIGEKRFRFRVRKGTGEVLFNENDTAKLLGFGTKKKFEQHIQELQIKKGGNDER